MFGPCGPITTSTTTSTRWFVVLTTKPNHQCGQLITRRIEFGWGTVHYILAHTAAFLLCVISQCRSKFVQCTTVHSQWWMNWLSVLPVVHSALHFGHSFTHRHFVCRQVQYSQNSVRFCSVSHRRTASQDKSNICSAGRSAGLSFYSFSSPLSHRVIDLAPINLNNVLPSCFDSLFLWVCVCFMFAFLFLTSPINILPSFSSAFFFLFLHSFLPFCRVILLLSRLPPPAAVRQQQQHR